MDDVFRNFAETDTRPRVNFKDKIKVDLNIRLIQLLDVVS